MNNHEHEHEPLGIPLLMGYSDSYVKMSKSRSIFFSENVTKRAGAELSALMLYYDNMDHESPISLYLHSNGGDVSGLSNIYDVMQMITAPIKTILLGKCYSAGAIILAAGTKGERYALRSSKVMIHGVQFAFPLPGHDITTSKNYYEFVRDNNDNMMKMLAYHTNHTLAQIKNDTVQDNWMSAKVALDYGIIDHII